MVRNDEYSEKRTQMRRETCSIISYFCRPLTM